MALTLLQIVDRACGEMGLAQPTSVIGASANQTNQLLALAQRLGLDLARDFEWQRLVKVYTFQTAAAVSLTGTTTNASAVVTGLSSTAALAAGRVVSGTGIPSYSEILTVDSGTQVTLTMPATASGSVTLSFARQDYAPPADFDRMVADSNWDRTDHWRNLGSRSSQDWQWLQGGVLSTGPRERYRIYNGNLRFFPALATVYNMAYEYVSSYWVVASGGSAGTKALFTLDTDTCVFPDDLMLAGLKFYFLKAKKLDFGIEMAEYASILSTRKAQDVPAPTQSLAPERLPEFIGPWSIQDGNWPTS